MFKNFLLKMAHINTQEEIDWCPFQNKRTKFSLTKLQEITLKSAVDFLYKNFYVQKASCFFYFLFQEAEGTAVPSICPSAITSSSKVNILSSSPHIKNLKREMLKFV